MLRLHAALRRTLQCLGSQRSLFSGSSQGLCTSIKHRESEREIGRGGATVLSVSFVAIGPPPKSLCKETFANYFHGSTRAEETRLAPLWSWGDFTAACFHYTYTFISNDPYCLNWKSSVERASVKAVGKAKAPQL